MKSIREEAYNRIKSFGYAFEGWWWVIKSQHNAWIHAVASLLVFVVGLWLRISPIEWSLIVIAVTIVWMGEFMNTAIEAIVDMVSPEYHRLAKVAKDVAAAGVLIGAGGAVIIALLIFGPKVWALFGLS